MSEYYDDASHHAPAERTISVANHDERVSGWLAAGEDLEAARALLVRVGRLVDSETDQRRLNALARTFNGVQATILGLERHTAEADRAEHRDRARAVRLRLDLAKATILEAQLPRPVEVDDDPFAAMIAASWVDAEPDGDGAG